MSEVGGRKSALAMAAEAHSLINQKTEFLISQDSSLMQVLSF
jgi:hypothetical protein